MRTTWIAIAIVALVVGLAVGYRLGRPGSPPQRSTPVEGASETAPDESPAPEKAAAARQAEPSVHESLPEQVERRPATYAEEALSPQPLEEENASELPQVASAPVVPAVIESEQPPPNPRTSEADVPRVAPPAAPTEEPAKENQTAEQVDDPESDRRPPVLEYLRFDPPETKGGGMSILSVGSTDDLSGVKLIHGSVRSPSGAAIVPFSARGATGGDVFTATIVVPPQAEAGEWFVANLQVVDKAENALTLAFARATVPEGGALRVVSEESDSTAPEVHRVSMVKDAVDAGEKNQIVVEVDDDRSGVALVTGAFQSPSKSAFIPFSCAPNGESSSWQGDVVVPANADCGEWTLRQLRVVDKANNGSFVSMNAPEIGHVGFVVSGGGACDSDPPVVDAMYFEPTIVSNAAAADVVVTVVAHDDVSGVASVSGWIEGPVATDGQSPRISFRCAPDSRDPGAPMTARIIVPQHAAMGNWRVTVAQVVDKARNARSYTGHDPALRDARFSVE
jgi:hypothetical protein